MTENQGIMFRFSTGGKHFSFLENIASGSGTTAPSSSMGTRSILPGSK